MFEIVLPFKRDRILLRKILRLSKNHSFKQNNSKRRSRRCLFRFLFGYQKGSGERGQSPEYSDTEIKKNKVKNSQVSDFFDKLRILLRKILLLWYNNLKLRKEEEII